MTTQSARGWGRTCAGTGDLMHSPSCLRTVQLPMVPVIHASPRRESRVCCGTAANATPRSASLALSVLRTRQAPAFGVDRGVVFAHHLWAEHHRPPAPTTTARSPGAPSLRRAEHTCTTGGNPQRDPLRSRRRGRHVDRAVHAGRVRRPLGGRPGGRRRSPPGPRRPDPGRRGGDVGHTGAGGARAAGLVRVHLPGDLCDGAVTRAGVVRPSRYQGSLPRIIVPQATTTLDVMQPLHFTYETSGFTVGPLRVGDTHVRHRSPRRRERHPGGGIGHSSPATNGQRAPGRGEPGRSAATLRILPP